MPLFYCLMGFDAEAARNSTEDTAPITGLLCGRLVDGESAGCGK